MTGEGMMVDRHFEGRVSSIDCVLIEDEGVAGNVPEER